MWLGWANDAARKCQIEGPCRIKRSSRSELCSSFVIGLFQSRGDDSCVQMVRMLKPISCFAFWAGSA